MIKNRTKIELIEHFNNGRLTKSDKFVTKKVSLFGMTIYNKESDSFYNTTESKSISVNKSLGFKKEATSNQ